MSVLKVGLLNIFWIKNVLKICYLLIKVVDLSLCTVENKEIYTSTYRTLNKNITYFFINL